MADVYEHPYGLRMSVDHTHAELGSPEAADVTLARIKPIVEKHGGQVVMEAPTLTKQHRLKYADIDWLLAPMDMSKDYPVPSTVYHRINAIEAEGVVFHQWVWGEEQFAKPHFSIAPLPAPTIITERPRSFFEQLFVPRSPLTDPIVIGIVYTTDATRGIWCCLGKWLH